MFALFLNDLEICLHNGPESDLTLHEICILVLLFADDMVIVGTSFEDIQCSLNRLNEYCDQWGLAVNVAKTKIVVFRKRGPTKDTEVWFYKNEKLEIVKDFNYMGVIFNFTGSFTLHNQYVIGKALRASGVLLSNLYKVEVNPTIALELFDTFVGSILSYGCQIWGFNKCKCIERIQLKFCKSLLGVKSATCSTAVYCELGRMPLYINRYLCIIKYWLKQTSTDNIIL